ncbi:minor capsid protein [Staphylococcus chromogenes]|uniref:minor capsid protein n=1 Tax=Staphylococcus chromogenes TaxID=46126 RepID=UPI002DB699F7|nr:minor capsid protein [Staphylococcus chromogenes]MEB7449871.1 minor capsid protein [Staphylococcus chromogenes]
MIEQPLKNYIRDNLDYDMAFTMNYSSVNDDVVTVYSDGGESSNYKGVLLKPRYQIFIKSSDFEKAYNVSNAIYELLDLHEPIEMTVSNSEKVQTYKVYFIESNLPIRLGVDEDSVMAYSINITTHIKRNS